MQDRGGESMTKLSRRDLARLLEMAADPRTGYAQLSTRELRQARVLEQNGLIDIVGTPETGCSLLLTAAGQARLEQLRNERP